jgi:DNA-binding NarL/FixJ family response regulator
LFALWALVAVVRILIADAHEIVRTGLRRIVESQWNWEVVAVAVDGDDAIRTAIESRPDVASLLRVAADRWH